MKKIIPIVLILMVLVILISVSGMQCELKPKPIELTEQDKVLAQSQNIFSFKLLQKLNENDTENSNIFISPSSIALALSMTYNGAREETKEAMEKTLEIENLTIEQVNNASKNIITFLNNPDPDIKLSVANSIWAREDIPFKEEFLETNNHYYNAEIQSLDFSDPKTVDAINAWAEEKTYGKIPEVIKEINPLDVMFLINAIYFKGDWTIQFNKTLTKDREFTLDDGTVKTVKMMEQKEEFNYMENEKFQAIELPYGKNERIAMYVFLPKDDINTLINSITIDEWYIWMRNFTKKEGTIIMPKFKIKYEKKLNDILSDMGMGIAFEPYGANFKGMADLSQNLFISYVKHFTYVDVNEEGTEAAAVTVVGMELTSLPAEPFYMEVNKPFFFVIREKQSGAILFTGIIKEPKTE